MQNKPFSGMMFSPLFAPLPLVIQLPLKTPNAKSLDVSVAAGKSSQVQKKRRDEGEEATISKIKRRSIS